jgi:predicted ATPase
VTESVLKTTISELRAALRDDARQPRYVETVPRRGYRFIGTPIAPAAVAPPPARVRERPDASARPPCPPHRFIGRAHELERLRAAWDTACGGNRQMVWVTGEAGVGKSALIDHFVAGLGTVACAFGHCVEQHAGGEPFLSVLEAVSELCRVDQDALELLRAVAPTSLRQLPWLAGATERAALSTGSDGGSRAGMVRELGEFLDRYTERRPLLLVTSNLHWSDAATVQLIDHIARRRRPAQLMWLGSFRLPEIVAADHPLAGLRRELGLHGLREEIVLDPFSEQEVGEYLALRAPQLAADEALVRDVHERSAGIPLFVVELADDLLSQADEGHAHGTQPALPSHKVPESLASVVEQSIRRLAPGQRALLEAASVCGIAFQPTVLAEALDRDPNEVHATCEALARRQLWLRDATGEAACAAGAATYAFRAPAFRQALYEQIGPTVRAGLQARIGAALDRADPA